MRVSAALRSDWKRCSRPSRLPARYGAEDRIEKVTRGEIYLVYFLGRHAALRAGLATCDVRARSNSDAYSPANRSTILLEFSGPVLGLDLMF